MVSRFSTAIKNPGEDASVEVLITWLYTGVVLMIVGMIVYQILVIPLEMTYYILADKPELKSTEAMKESLEMMHGNFGRYLMLKISFIPLMFLSVFTFFFLFLHFKLPCQITIEHYFCHSHIWKYPQECNIERKNRKKHQWDKAYLQHQISRN